MNRPEPHEHDWRVANVCKDWCRICLRMKRVCPRGHRHNPAALDGIR